MEWEQWKTEFQKIMYDNELKAEHIEQLSDPSWSAAFKEWHKEGLSPKDAYEEYLEQASEEAP